MPSIFTELARRKRAALTDHVARELRSSLGGRRAEVEAGALADELAALRGDVLAAWSAIQARARSWKRRRVPMRAIGRILGGLISLAAPATASRASAADAARQAAPGLEPGDARAAHSGDQASLNARLQNEITQKEKFAALLAVSHAVVNTLELNTVFATIVKQVRQVIQADECTVFLYDETDQLLKPVVCDIEQYQEEMMSVHLKLGEGITGYVAMTGRGEIVQDVENDPRAFTVPNTPSERASMMCVPLTSREKVVGVITMTRNGERWFDDPDLELATLFAGQCSAAISNARLFEEMKAAYEELRQTQTQLVQSAKLNALGEMAGGVAHDFNNILAAILGRTQLLLQHAEDGAARRQLQVIEQAALDGAHTVRRVQAFTRVRQDESFETLDLNQVVMGVVELTRTAWEAGAKRRGLSI
ncbi:MAG: GAF domain-containing protein, partial [Candidatus Eiseniibacteriota bacterium]